MWSWSRLGVLCCFCLLLTGVSSCPKTKKEVSVRSKMNFAIKQVEGKRVFFDFDKSDINEASLDKLLDVVEVLQNNPDAKVTLTGHADRIGSHEYNIALGGRRADAAKKAIIGCAPYLESRIRTASKGETEPFVVVEDVRNSKNEEKHAKNRRVEFSFSGIKK